jgi:hypothetical protein
VTALAVATFGGAAVVGAGAASAAPRAHTSLSIRTAHHVINPGGKDWVSGNLRARSGPVKGDVVRLLARTSTTAWAQVASEHAARGGNVGFSVTPSVDTRYVLAFRGNRFQKGSRSGVVRVAVRDTTALSIAVADTSITKGATDSVSGVLSLDSTPIAGDTVNLIARNAHHKWAKVGSAVTGTDGSVSFTVTPQITTRYQLVFHATSADAGARSDTATVHVLMPSSLSIRLRSNARKGIEIISGNLRGGGKGLAGRKIMLQDRASGTTTWTTVATKGTGKGGNVSFSVAAPTASEDYQLVFAGGPNFDGCVSPIGTV